MSGEVTNISVVDSFTALLKNERAELINLNSQIKERMANTGKKFIQYTISTDKEIASMANDAASVLTKEALW